MEILNILYSNNLIAVYLIGAILVVILILIILSSMTTTPNEKILKDPTEEENDLDNNFIEIKKQEEPDTSKINDMVEELYQKSLEMDNIEKEEVTNLNSFLEEFEVPENVIEEVEEVVNEEIKEPIQFEEQKNEIEKQTEEKTNIEDMLKRLYELRQSENESRKNVLLNEIYDLKKQVDEALKSDTSNITFDYDYVDTKALADYYLFNEDIEFPKLK